MISRTKSLFALWCTGMSVAVLVLALQLRGGPALETDLLALLPATAALVGALVLGQWPSLRDIAGVGLVMASVFLHRARDV